MKKTRKRNKLVAGVGINDVDELTNYGKDKNGKEIRDPLYMRWKGLLSRCYLPSVYGHKVNARYEFCSVDERWFRLSKFNEWMKSHEDWENMQIDKDLLVPGNTVYGPDTCCLLPKEVNALLIDQVSKHSNLKGVAIRGNNFYAVVKVNGKFKYVKCATEEEAHELYKETRYSQILAATSLVKEQKIKDALVKFAERKYGPS